MNYHQQKAARYQDPAREAAAFARFFREQIKTFIAAFRRILGYRGRLSRAERSTLSDRTPARGRRVGRLGASLSYGLV